jgi:hypothetical protein
MPTNLSYPDGHETAISRELYGREIEHKSIADSDFAFLASRSTVAIWVEDRNSRNLFNETRSVYTGDLAASESPFMDEHVNTPQTAAELEAVRRAICRNQPFGNDAWQQQVAKRLGLESTLRPRGRPRKTIRS